MDICIVPPPRLISKVIIIAYFGFALKSRPGVLNLSKLMESFCSKNYFVDLFTKIYRILFCRNLSENFFLAFN